MQTNDEILITPKGASAEPLNFTFLKFSKNVPLNCEISANHLKDILICQSTVIAEAENGAICEFTLASVTIQKLFNKLHDKI